MTHTRNNLRTAILALSASIVLPTAPVFGQEPVTIAPPPPVSAAPPPAASPPPVLRIEPVAPAITPPRARAPAPAPVARTVRAAPRAAAPRVRAEAPARRATPAPAVAAAPAPAPAPAAAAPVAAETVAPPAPVPVETTPVADAVPVVVDETGGGSILPFVLIGAALLVGALAFFTLRRRRRASYGYDETYYEEPAAHDEPVVAPEPSIARAAPFEPAPVIAAAPAFSAAAAAPAAPSRDIEEANVVEADGADIEALAASSEPVSGRPWLEFLMRPIRAGTSQDDAIVQFELTVGNTGSVAARDVRISTWMVAAGQGTDMEHSLIVPAGAQFSEVDIAAGDGARVEGEVALSKTGLGSEPVLPVVVADARYMLPDGSEGHTHAAFAVGLPDDESDDLTPFPVDRSSGLLETVEARLHGEPERV